MKILFFINTLEGGGAEKLLNEMVTLFNNIHYCEVLVLSMDNDKYSKNILNKGIKITVVPYKNHILRVMFTKAFVKGKFDLVHANLFPTFYYLSLARILSLKFPKIVMTEHNTYNRRRKFKFLFLLERIIYSSFDKVISITEETRDKLIEWLRFKKTDKRFITIYNGINLSTVQQIVTIPKQDIFKNISVNDFLICMVGSFTIQKNHKIIIEIMKLLPINFKLVLVGEGPLLPTIVKLVTENFLDDRIKFLGFRSDALSIVKSSDLILIPSLWEGFGLVAVEAMSLGKKIVFSNVPGLSTVIGENGFKVSNFNDAREFYNVILKASYEPINETNIIKRARLFSIDVMLNKYLLLFDNLLEK